MTRLVCEVAALSDSINKAAKVAPTRGDAFLRANGLVIKTDGAGNASLQATDLLIFYAEALSVNDASGPSSTWRIPSSLATSLMTSLAAKNVKECALDDSIEPGRLMLTAGKTKARVALLPMAGYPTWELFDSSDFIHVTGLGPRIRSVEWAINPGMPGLGGVLIKGPHVIAIDRFRIARARLDDHAGFDQAVAVPSGALGRILPYNGDVAMAVTEGALLLMPDEYTQVRAITMNNEYPAVERVIDREWPYKSTFTKSEFLGILSSSMSFIGNERNPRATMYVGKGAITINIGNPELGAILDTISVTGDAENHARMSGTYQPQFLRDAVSNCPDASVTMHYIMGEKVQDKMLKFTNADNSYEAVVAAIGESRS